MLPFVLGYAGLMLVLVAAVQQWRPRWSKWRTILVSSLPGPLLVLAAAVIGITFIVLGPRAENEVDASAMTVAAFAYLSVIAIPTTFVTGILTGWLFTTIFSLDASD
ncbi:MAG: hypothetical protein ABL883_06185 [Terricaulis sp.]